MDLLSGDIELRSKREMIEKFIQENLPKIDNADNIQDEFEKYSEHQARIYQSDFDRLLIESKKNK